MTRVVGLTFLTVAIWILGASAVASSSTGVNYVFLPIVANHPPTTTPTQIPTPAPLIWTTRAALPSWLFANGGAATGKWSTLTPKALVTTGMGAAQAGDGNIYLAGGSICACGSGLPPQTVLVYDPKTDSWATQTSLQWGEQSPSVVVLGGTDVYVVGGWNDESYDLRVEEATIP